MWKEISCFGKHNGSYQFQQTLCDEPENVMESWVLFYQSNGK
jgi:hypothetical protein